MPYSDTSLQAIRIVKIAEKSELLSVMELVMIRGVDSPSFLTAMLKGKETKPYVVRHVAIVTYGSN
jgi:hypothetical protein